MHRREFLHLTLSTPILAASVGLETLLDTIEDIIDWVLWG